MTLRFKTIQTEGIAQLSYFIGDDSAGTAAVIDPRIDCGIYLDIAREFGLSITHVFETHIHADFMSGSRELRKRTGKLDVFVSGESAPEYGQDCIKVYAGDTFSFGKAVLTARHTPGHTPEHLAYEVADKGKENEPWAVFSGDALLMDSAGRPDLLGESEKEELTEKLYHTLQGYFMGLKDGVIVFPCHSAGSACGASIGDHPATTIGRERENNPFLKAGELDTFKKLVGGDSSPVPAHYPRLKKINLEPPAAGNAPSCPALPPKQFRDKALSGDFNLVDTRDMLAFGGSHVKDAINIGGQPELSVFSGDMLDPEKAILLVVADDRKPEEIIALMWRVGYTRFAGYLCGGMKAWHNAGLESVHLPQITVQELNRALPGIQPLDVRTDEEWKGGHVRQAVHRYVGDLRCGAGDIRGVDKTKSVATYCGTGYRASIAASILQREGYTTVLNVPGSWTAWKAAGLPVEETAAGKETR